MSDDARERGGTRVIALLFTSMFLSGTENLVMSPVLPQIAAELGVPMHLAAHWVTAYALLTGVSAFVFGPISDRNERKHVLVAGLSILGLGTVVCGLAGSFWTLIFARALTGVGAGILLTSTTSYIADFFTVARRGTAMGLIMNGFFVALMFGVPVGSTIASFAGWRAMFWVLGGFGLLLAIAMGSKLPPIAGNAAVDDFHTAQGDAPARAGGLRGALQGYRQVLARGYVWGLLQTAFLVGTSMTMFSVYLSPWLEAEFGFDTFWRGVAYAIGAPAAVITAPIAGRWSARVGRLPLIIFGNVATSSMMVLVAMSSDFGLSLRAAFTDGGEALQFVLRYVPLFGFSILLMSGSAARGTGMQTLTAEAVESDLRGSMAALRNVAFQISVATGASVGGWIWARGGDSFLAICVCGTVLTLLSTIPLYALSKGAPGAFMPSPRP